MSDGIAAPDYGGDGIPDGDRIAAVIDRLREHQDRLGGHATLDLLAWDDGTLSAQLVHTVEHLPDDHGENAAVAKEAVRWDTETEQVRYHEFVVRGDGAVRTEHEEVVEP